MPEQAAVSALIRNIQPVKAMVRMATPPMIHKFTLNYTRAPSRFDGLRDSVVCHQRTLAASLRVCNQPNVWSAKLTPFAATEMRTPCFFDTQFTFGCNVQQP